MKRFVALIAVVALILGAIWIRQQLDGDSSAEPGSNGGPGGQPLRLLCEPLMERACRAVDGAEVTVEPPLVTIKRISTDGRLDADAWVTLDVWPTIANGRRGQAWLTAPRAVLATTQPVIGGVEAQMSELAGQCGDAVTWKCVGDSAIRGALRVGLPDKMTSEGLATLAALATSFIGRADFVSNDFDDGFRDWIRGVRAQKPNVSFGGTPLENLALAGPAAGIVGGLAAKTPANVVEQITVTRSTPELRFRAVVVAPTDVKVPEALTDAFGDPWGSPDEQAISPSGGVLDALLNL